MAPLREDWADVQAAIAPQLQRLRELKAEQNGSTPSKKPKGGLFDERVQETESITRAVHGLYSGFLTKLKSIRVLDPACGSGNFLYLALRQMKDLEKDVLRHMAESGFPQEYCWAVTPAQFLGIDVNPYSLQLAQVVIWIGYFQWMRENGFLIAAKGQPLIAKGTTIEERDAILDLSDPANPGEPPWPECTVIIGNPPFLGGKFLRRELGDAYVDAMFQVYGERLPAEADLCCYWFEKARSAIVNGRCHRAGLLATNSIRGGANRFVLESIDSEMPIFMAWSDNEWVLDGAAVRISIIGFGNGVETRKMLDGEPVARINADLTTGLDMTQASQLIENDDIAYMGDTKNGPFDITHEQAVYFLSRPNPHGRSNSEVLRPWCNAADVVRRSRDMWIIDFGDQSVQEAGLFEAPFEYIRKNVKPLRATNSRAKYRDEWWIHCERRPGMLLALSNSKRYIATPCVSKHRIFTWLDSKILPDHRLIIFGRSDDYFFGVLHSKLHELWTLSKCSWQGVGNDPVYIPTVVFQTFPLPWPPGSEPKPKKPGRDLHDAIAKAAAELDKLRERWLNPPEWIILEPPPVEGYPPRILPKSEAVAKDLAKRTLTNLYNERPDWLARAHEALDKAVHAAYGWEWPLPEDEVLRRLLELNHLRAGK